MGKKIGLLIDSTSDITKEMVEKLDVEVVDAPVLMDGKIILGSSVTTSEFHKMMDQAKEFPSTSQPSPKQFIEGYENLISRGYTDIVSVHLSSNLSGTINSAYLAKSMIEDKVAIHIMDTNTASIAYLACINYTRQLLDASIPIHEIKTRVESFGNSLEGYFSVGSLDNLVRGGRLSRPRYILGKLLNFKPVLILKSGVIKSFKKVRGIQNSRDFTYSSALKKMDKDDEFNFIIAHVEIPEIAESYYNLLKNEYPKSHGHIQEIGPAISVHSGRNSLMIVAFKYPDI
jgi:DegV family protein with EDD domain